jgi:DmsE family decaheme c-type cytochrome
MFLASLAIAGNGPDGDYASRGEKTCLRCHDEKPVKFILNTAHAQTGDERSPFAKHQCETCHGPSAAHMIKPSPGEERAPPAIDFAPGSGNPVAERNGVCLRCHESGARIHWKGSTHQASNVACTSCHEIHTLHDAVRDRQTQFQVCFGCHKTQRAEVWRRSHHPIEEGQVTCNDCHAPHGEFGKAQLVGGTVNDTCYRCHADKRGPFLWEHAPVREDCTICHNPHGSTQDSLLKTRTPWLCQQCHSAEFHPSTLYDGTGVPPSGADAHLLLRSCLNCHPRVHGSNHPSGPRFTR